MSNIMNISEVVEFAVYIEKNGYKFYVDTLKKFNDAKFVQLFQYLADEEFKHEKTFSQLLSQVGTFIPNESYAGEYDAYMKQFISMHALANDEVLKTKMAGIKSVNEAVALALDFEKDSIILFEMLKKYIQPEKQYAVEAIIQEEITHIYKINEFFNALK